MKYFSQFVQEVVCTGVDPVVNEIFLTICTRSCADVDPVVNEIFLTICTRSCGDVGPV